jgi:hypothetical protein
LRVPAAVGWHGQFTEPAAQLVEDDRDMDVFVRIDADGDLADGRLVRDAVHGCRSFPVLAARGPGGRTGL